jgi:hypothetical protein
MRKRFWFLSIGAAVLVVCGLAVAQPLSSVSIARLNPELTQQAQRACIFPAGGWTIINCSNVAAATSSQLNAWSRYVIQCGDDSYLATGDEATDVADANDGWLSSGAWLEFMTTSTVRYISCLNKTADSDCRIWECQ